MTIIKVRQYDKPFVQLDKRILADNRLTWKAKGVLAYLLSKPDDWCVRVRDLIRQSVDGEYAVRSALKELLDAGYAERTQEKQRDGTFAEVTYTIQEIPHRGFREAAPHRGYPHAGNRAHTNNESTNNEGRVRKKDDNTERAPTTSSSGNGQVSGETDQPKRVVAGTGDRQQDTVDSIGAGVNVVQGKELVARAMYHLMWPTLDWPEGKTKRAKEARQSAVIAADRVLERIGRDNYQQALDACHLLTTQPTKDEGAWIDGAKTIYGLVDFVTRKISDMRKDRVWPRRHVFEDYSGLEIDPTLNAKWDEAMAIVKAQVTKGTWDIWLENAELLAVMNGLCLVRLDGGGVNEGARMWMERALSNVMDRPIEVVFDGEQTT